MEVESFQKVVYDIGPTTATADAVEDIACGFHRQRGDDRALAVSGDSGDARGNTETDSLEVTELLHYSVYPPSVRSLGVEDGFRIVKEYNHLP